MTVISHASNNDLIILKQVYLGYIYTKKPPLIGVKIPSSVTVETSE